MQYKKLIFTLFFITIFLFPFCMFAMKKWQYKVNKFPIRPSDIPLWKKSLVFYSVPHQINDLSWLKNLEKLEKLLFHLCDFSKGAMDQISQIQNLKKLSLIACKNIDDNHLKKLFKGKLSNLEELAIMQNPKITDEGIKYISNGNLSNLKSLALSWDHNITDNGIGYIASGKLKNLYELYLTKCNVTDKSIRLLANGNTQKIRGLCFDGCKKLSPDILKMLALEIVYGEKLKNLKYVELPSEICSYKEGEKFEYITGVKIARLHLWKKKWRSEKEEE